MLRQIGRFTYIWRITPPNWDTRTQSAAGGGYLCTALMELLERQIQLDELARLLREAGTKGGKVAFITGEAGTGKSVLVEQFARNSAGATRVLWGYCDALQTSRVLGPVNELLSGLSDTPARESCLSREQLFSLLLERFSPPNPFVTVVLEDLHWADEATLDFVRYIGRRIQRTRCLLIATYRDDEVAALHPLRAVLGDLTGPHTARISTPALSLAAVRLLAGATPHDADRLYRLTGGNPFFVRELLSASTDSVPQTVRDAVVARLLQCSAESRELAELVALTPGRTELWLARSILGNVVAAADEAVARGLLRHYDDAIAFRHELGRLAVESTIPRARAQTLHQAILRTLRDFNADLSRLVHHASHADDTKAVLEYAPRAAHQAALAGAHREAAAHLTTALRHGHPLRPFERARLLELRAIECDMTNHVATAIESAGQALALWQELGDVTAQARVLLLLERQYWKSGQKLTADRHMCAAIALLEQLPASSDLAMAYSARSQRAMTSQHTAEALKYGQQALELATQFADLNVQAHALNNMGAALLSCGDQSGLTKLEQSLALALQHGLQEHAGRAYANLVSIAVRQHLSEPARRYISEGTEYCEVHEVQDCLSYIRAYGAHYDLHHGSWEAAAVSAAELLEHYALAVAQRIPALLALALVRARRGDPGVDTLLDEAQSLALPTGELQRIAPVAVARAEVAWYRGDLQRVAHETTVGLSALTGHQDPWIAGELSCWARRASLPCEVSAEWPDPYVSTARGDWKGAASAWERLGMPYERALALAEGPEDALRESLSILEELGAGPATAIVRRRLRELGARRISRGPRTSTRSNPAGLTTREVQVLRLLVHGHTNTEASHRLHLSVKTVEHHVSSILAKLAVHSRTEAVAAAFGLGIAKPADSTASSGHPLLPDERLPQRGR